ncbi:MAG: phosphotransferase [Phycisphaerae bacterium]|jgi:homoserine kinase type II|nr:phosphotransferase [Phycisphaerae bacterium]MCZ2401545.1 phosphotransferase [Phycisphaerae bacterium]
MTSERERFSPSELTFVLSRYDVGSVLGAREVARGSRRSPKLLLTTTTGRYILKRRVESPERAARAEFAHALIQHLVLRRFPVASPVRPIGARETLLVHDGAVYELFEFVEGEAYDGSLEQTTNAGQTLARFHRAISDFDATWPAARASYHDSANVREALHTVPTSAASHDSVAGHEAELLSLTQELHERYDQASTRANELGFADWPPWIVHGDWHPGNLLFRNTHVCAVLDFDSVRMQPRTLDLANAMLQFSILRGGGDLEQWPSYFDLTRMRRFYIGYLTRLDLPPDQRRALLPLMIESVVAESVVPVALTGSFGQIPGFGLLQVVRRKVRWLLDHADQIEPWLLE